MQCRMPINESGRSCNEQLYQCRKCKAMGCKNIKCRNYGFDGMRCLRCGEFSATG